MVMKMFVFEPNTYDKVFCVMAKDSSSAINSVIYWHWKEMMNEKKENEEHPSYQNVYRGERYDRWRQADVNHLPDGYTIHEYDERSVWQGEYA